MTTKSATQAIVRRVSPSYAASYRRIGVSIDQDRALAQHHAYVEALRDAGLGVDIVEADVERYDCVFVEDTAVVWDSHALVTRMLPDREGEQPPVEEHLRRSHEIVRLPSGATLEGGDVLHVDAVTYVGLSSRTNRAGAEALRGLMNRFGRPVRPVPVVGALHLKTVVTYLGNGTLIAAPGAIGKDSFGVGEIIFTEPEESRAANCLLIRDRLLIPARCPVTERRLRQFADEHGIRVVPLDISEFEKGEGSVTCLSLIW